ncbi:MAG: hypothetical protein A2498_04725 [Lentisphaerae bacterium RIFOXYC12_FULL_60_16]|nr:MAG: hypothetical protein A2498_04725 [Lentisphaerae bacterium RIFOXYC12_FULL_60_16]OGV77936.1 MAG: hypothetical protein A2340_10225 [Lentisphaerae bacterium RIFOXYB12_FULL_60_10]
MPPPDRFRTSAWDTVGHSLDLLRLAPASVTARYFIGTVPFALAFLYFWTDMSRSAFAPARCLPFSLVLALLFLWMKYWQASFTTGLRHHLLRRNEPHGSFHTRWRRLTNQAILQPAGLLLIPLSLLVLMPFHLVYGFHQNTTALDDGTDSPLALARKAWRYARERTTHSLLIIWLIGPWLLALAIGLGFTSAGIAITMTPDIQDISGPFWLMLMLALLCIATIPLCPVGCVVAGNIAFLLLGLPEILHRVLGIQSLFQTAGLAIVFNTTFPVTLMVLSAMVLDPVVKTAYLLRCFESESIESGADLLADLQAEDTD